MNQQFYGVAVIQENKNDAVEIVKLKNKINRF